MAAAAAVSWRSLSTFTYTTSGLDADQGRTCCCMVCWVPGDRDAAHGRAGSAILGRV
jgi:hypothetical protein